MLLMMSSRRDYLFFGCKYFTKIEYMGLGIDIKLTTGG